MLAVASLPESPVVSNIPYDMSQQQETQDAPDKEQRSEPSDKWYKVRFRTNDQIFTAGAKMQNLKPDENVMVITDHGPEPAMVVGLGPQPVLEGDLADLKPALKIQRRCNNEEKDKFARLIAKEEEAFTSCVGYIKKHKLAMKLIKVERFFNGSKIIFYFTADGRVDFRELVRDLAQHFRTRIEMRQIGVRDASRMLGGIGACGVQLCCSTYLREFQPVSIRMAKEQSLSLNPTKISGQCGRLMCCLTYEYENYRALKKNLPKIGKPVMTEKGKGKVIRHNPICNCITVRLEGGMEIETTVNQTIKD